MHVALFVPDTGDGPAVLAAVEKAFSRMRPVKSSGGPDQAHAAAAAALEGAGKHEILLVNPPPGPDDLARLDALFRERFGKRGLPRAVFFAPPAARKGDDPLADYREGVRPAFRHYWRDGRAFEFRRLRPKEALKAVKLARKAASPVRWGALGPALLLLVAVLAAAFLFRDLFARRAFTGALQSSFGARAEMNLLATTLTPALHVKTLAVADREKPMQNLFEFEEFTGALDLMALTAGNFHVEEATLTGLKFATPRTASGALPETAIEPGDGPEPEPEPESAPAEGMDFGAALDDVLDGLKEKFEPPKLRDLETVKAAQNIEKECRERFARLQSDIEGLRLEARLEEVRGKIKALGQRKPPASFEAARERMKEFGSLSLGQEELEAAQAGLAKAAGTALAEEKAALEKAQADLASVKATIDKARSLVTRARKIKQVTILDVPEITTLLEDLDRVNRELPGVQKRLASTTTSLDRARQGLAAKTEGFQAALAGGNADAAKARGALDAAAPKLAAAAGALEKDLAGAKADLEKEKTEVLNVLDGIAGEGQALLGEAKAIEGNLEGDLRFLAAQPAVLEAAFETDTKNIQDRYGLESLDAESILKALVGGDLAGWILEALALYERFKPLLVREREDKAAVERHAAADGGTVFAFAVEAEPASLAPRFWIKRLRFSGVLPVKGKDFVLEGTAENVATNLPFTGKAMKVTFRAEKEGEALEGEIEVDPSGRTRVRIAATGFRVSGIRFTGRYVPREIKADALSVTVEAAFGAGPTEARAALGIEGLAFTTDFSGVDRRIASVLEKVFSGIRSAHAEIAATFDGGRLAAFRTETDLAAEVERVFRDALSEEIEVVRKDAMALLEEKTREPRDKALASAERFSADARARLAPVLKDAGLGAELLAADRDAALGRLGELGEALGVGADPQKALAARRKLLDEVEGKLEGEARRFAADREAQEALLEEVASRLNGENDRKGETSKDLGTEIDRLKELVKKASPW